MSVSTKSQHNLTDVLNPDELENLDSPEIVDEVPNARISEWEDMTAVVSPGKSIAGYMDRFRAGSITPMQRKTLNGLHSDIVGDRSQAIFMSEELKDRVGDKAYVRLGNDDQTFAVDIRTPEEVYDTLEKYQEQYAGDVIQMFEEDIESNNIVLPVNYEEGEGVLREAPTAVVTGPEVMANEVEPMQMVDAMLEPEEVENLSENRDLNVYSREAGGDTEAEYEVEVMASGYEVNDYHMHKGNLIMETPEGVARAGFIDKDLAGEAEITGENNGVYTVEVR
jgi:hypothetical protein